MRFRVSPAVVVLLLLAGSASAQQRPLVTEDPETIGAGRVLIEGGVDLAHGYQNPASGLEGNLVSIPTIGISVGLSSIAELQIDGGLYNSLSISRRDPNAPLASLLTVTGDSTHDVSNAVIATKIRILAETASRPAVGIRFATKLPNASNEKGIDLDTTDVSGTLLLAKTVQFDPCRRQHRRRHSDEPDIGSGAERRVVVRPFVREGGDPGGRAGGRTEWPRLHALQRISGNREPGTSEARRTLHAWTDPLRRRHLPWADDDRFRRLGLPPASRTSSTPSRSRSSCLTGENALGISS